MSKLVDRRRAGMTLLEVVVALVILSCAVTAGLGSLASSLRLARNAQVWEQAAEFAARAMENAKTFGVTAAPRESLPDGYWQRVSVQRLTATLQRIDVTVGLPTGQTLQVSRIVVEPL